MYYIYFDRGSGSALDVFDVIRNISCEIPFFSHKNNNKNHIFIQTGLCQWIKKKILGMSACVFFPKP